MDRLLQRLQENKSAVTAGAVVASAAAFGYALYRQLHIPGTLVETTQHGGDLVAKVLEAHGVKFVFTLVGGHISPILVASKQRGIKVVDVRHEVTAVFAADAVARLSGVPGVAAVTAGPGLTNTITAVKNAQMAESPVVLISGAAATVVKGRGALQDIDQMSVVKSIVKFSATCTSVRDIVPTLRRAFREAMSGVPGPVFVEFPIDVLYQVSEIRANMGLSTRKRIKELKPEEHSRVILPVESPTLEEYVHSRSPEAPVFLKKDVRLPFVVKKYLEYKLRNLFSGAFDPVDVSPLPVCIPQPSTSALRKTHDLLRAAKKPVMIVASQATLFCAAPGDSPTAPVDALRHAVETLGIPTFLSGMARGLLGADSPIHVRQNRRVALAEADVVILAGAVPDFRLDYGRVFSRKSAIVTVNRNPDALKQNTDLFWHPKIACLADPATFLIKLAETMGDCTGQFAKHAASLKSGQAAKEAANLKKSKEPAYGRTGQLVNPLALCHEIDAVLPEKSVLVADGGDFIGTAAYIVRPRGPLCWLDPGAFGTLGVGGGFALGAALCRPDHEVWLLWGDGSCGYSVAEYDTFKRHGVSIIAVVGNDACWTQIQREQIPIFNDDVACPLLYTNYDTVATGYGGTGRTISSATEDVRKALQESQEDRAEGQSVLVNVHIGSTSFREGSISV